MQITPRNRGKWNSGVFLGALVGTSSNSHLVEEWRGWMYQLCFVLKGVWAVLNHVQLIQTRKKTWLTYSSFSFWHGLCSWLFLVLTAANGKAVDQNCKWWSVFSRCQTSVYEYFWFQMPNFEGSDKETRN